MHKPSTGRWQNPNGEELPFWKQEQKEEKKTKPIVGFIVLMLAVVAVVAGGLVYGISNAQQKARELRSDSVGASVTAPRPTYYLNTYRMKFHKPDCPSVQQMMDENRQAFYGTREEAIAKGYSPCNNCKP